MGHRNGRTRGPDVRAVGGLLWESVIRKYHRSYTPIRSRWAWVGAYIGRSLIWSNRHLSRSLYRIHIRIHCGWRAIVPGCSADETIKPICPDTPPLCPGYIAQPTVSKLTPPASWSFWTEDIGAPAIDDAPRRHGGQICAKRPVAHQLAARSARSLLQPELQIQTRTARTPLGNLRIYQPVGIRHASKAG